MDLDLAEYIQQCQLEDQAGLEEYMANRSAGSPVPSDDSSLSSLDLNPPGGSRIGPQRGPLRALQAFNVSAKLVQGCAAPGCPKFKDLIHCSCKAIQYCSREHQLADRQAHRSICSKVKKAYAKLEKEERALKREQGADIFEESRGIFWSRYTTRDYMRARFTLVEALLKINTAQAVTSALDHLLDMLQLCRIDTLGVRDVVPGLYLRLGREQETFDFCWWWLEVRGEANEGMYDWNDNSLPFLDAKGLDVFCDVQHLLDNYNSLSHIVAITLLKIRLMIDMQSLKRAELEAGPHVPREILDTIQNYSISSDITVFSRIIKHGNEIPYTATLDSQIRDLYAAVEDINTHFWPALIHPGNNLRAQPTRYTFGDEAQMQLVLQYNYNAWAETPGAIGVIEELSNR